jgi:outer membrane lipoprotein SlyB
VAKIVSYRVCVVDAAAECELDAPTTTTSASIDSARSMQHYWVGGLIRMKVAPRLTVITVLMVFASACATTTTASTTWTDESAPGYWPRRGRVESVREIVRRQEGNPVGGALAGGLIGGFLFGGRGPGALVGAAGGAAVGAAASQGAAETRTYQVLVRFDDGTYGMFVYGGYSPFRPGEAVQLTPQGLARL